MTDTIEAVSNDECTITVSGLVKRINRVLRRWQNVELSKSRNAEERAAYGDYYIYDGYDVLAENVNPVKLAKEMWLLPWWEAVVDEFGREVEADGWPPVTRLPLGEKTVG